MSNKRIDLVDALRGFAIMAILVLHNLEHFDFVYKPDMLPPFIQSVDKQVWATVKFLFAGKAYAIFALLFGFSFFLMDRKQQEMGVDFRGRFLWRMLILLGFGLVNSAFYQGDILTIYAVLGVTLVLVCRWRTQWILLTLAVLLLQPIEIVRLAMHIVNPVDIGAGNTSHHYFELSHRYLSGPSLWDVLKGNFVNGRIGVWVWSWEKGRFLQTPALFMIGFLLGKHGRFSGVEANLRFWKTFLMVALVAAVPLYFATANLNFFTESKLLKSSLKLILNSYYSFSIMCVWVSSFVLLYQFGAFQRAVSSLRLLGRMSLTNYVMQSVLGAFIYYGFGLGLYFYTGATYSLIIAVVMLFLQVQFCKWWLKAHAQGPLEYLWHKGTWVRFRGGAKNVGR